MIWVWSQHWNKQSASFDCSWYLLLSLKVHLIPFLRSCLEFTGLSICCYAFSCETNMVPLFKLFCAEHFLWVLILVAEFFQTSATKPFHCYETPRQTRPVNKGREGNKRAILTPNIEEWQRDIITFCMYGSPWPQSLLAMKSTLTAAIYGWCLSLTSIVSFYSGRGYQSKVKNNFWYSI